MEATAVQRVACIGTGVIGGGWVAYFLSRGYDVGVWDPDPEAKNRLKRLLANAWPALQQLGVSPEASPNRWTMASHLSEAVDGAQFIQESAPERLEVKIDLLAQIDRAAPPDVVIASSTSGYTMTEMQQGCAHPERTVVGHPFNPPYLIPLVEVVGGKNSSPASVQWATEFYEAAGKSVLKLQQELPGFIANRLQEALWREALHMVAQGEATVAQIDASITAGPGLRWAFMGPCLTFHLAGGQGGMAHMLDHFGPSLDSPWTRLQAPPLTPELRKRMVEGCLAAANQQSIETLVQKRDAALIAMLKALKPHHIDQG